MPVSLTLSYNCTPHPVFLLGFIVLLIQKFNLNIKKGLIVLLIVQNLDRHRNTTILIRELQSERASVRSFDMKFKSIWRLEIASTDSVFGLPKYSQSPQICYAICCVKSRCLISYIIYFGFELYFVLTCNLQCAR